MRAVIFGGSGFLGSHVADILTERGGEITIYDLKPSRYIKESQKMVIGDILDQKKVESVVSNAEVVYNFAGIADIAETRINPVETVRQNILGNAVILEASRKSKIKRFVFASSVYVYSSRGSFYRSSKQACELIIEDYQRSFDINFTILRYGSLYGPRADERNWIFSMLKQALLDNRIVREGDGEEIRDYIHVCDAARISTDILDERYKNQFVIISGNQAIKIKDLLLMVREMLNNKIAIEYTPPHIEEHYEITPYSFNPKIAKKIISDSYLDLGQGLLEVLDNIHQEILLKDSTRKQKNNSIARRNR